MQFFPAASLTVLTFQCVHHQSEATEVKCINKGWAHCSDFQQKKTHYFSFMVVRAFVVMSLLTKEILPELLQWALVWSEVCALGQNYIYFFGCKRGFGYLQMVSSLQRGKKKEMGCCKAKRRKKKNMDLAPSVMHFHSWVKKEHHAAASHQQQAIPLRAYLHLFVPCACWQEFYLHMRLAFAQILSEKDASQQLCPSLTPTLNDFGRKIKKNARGILQHTDHWARGLKGREKYYLLMPVWYSQDINALGFPDYSRRTEN